MADFLRARNPKVLLYLMATWSRADQTYPPTGAWTKEPIETMARDVRAAYDKAAAGAAAKGVIPVGEAWTRAMQTGVADPNPYDGIDAGKLDLWTHDHYHGSVYGYYLEALTISEPSPAATRVRSATTNARLTDWACHGRRPGAAAGRVRWAGHPTL